MSSTIPSLPLISLFYEAASERAEQPLRKSLNCLVRSWALFLNTFDFLLHQNAQFLPY